MYHNRGMTMEQQQHAALQRLLSRHGANPPPPGPNQAQGGAQPPHPGPNQAPGGAHPPRPGPNQAHVGGNQWRPPCRGPCPGGPGHVHLRDIPAIVAHNRRERVALPPVDRYNLTALINDYKHHKERSENIDDEVGQTKEWKTSGRATMQCRDTMVLKLEADARAHKAAMINIRTNIFTLVGSDVGNVAEFLIELAADEVQGRYGKRSRWGQGRTPGRGEEDEEEEDELDEEMQQPQGTNRKGKKPRASRE